MHLSQSLRFRGYWLSLLSWLMVSFASPLSSAFAETNQGWMRLCSTYGVHWISHSDSEDATQYSKCHCLGQALSSYPPSLPQIDVPGFFSLVAEYSVTLHSPHYLLPPSRAPPFPHRG